MAKAARRAIRRVEDTSDDIADHLSHQIAALRREIASIAEAVSDYGGHTLEDVQQNAVALAKELRHQGVVVGRQVGRQAKVAGRVVQEHPVPVIVTLATIALLATLLFSRD